MPHIRKLLASLSLLTVPAWADIARPPAASPPAPWPQWAVVAVTFALFLALIVFVSRFFRGPTGGDNNRDRDGM